MTEQEQKSAIWLPKSTIEKLKQKGKKGETYDDVIRRLLEVYEKFKDVKGEIYGNNKNLR
jgi:hypothetical protein